MKKSFLFFLLFLLTQNISVKAEDNGDYYISKYDIMDLDFLRTHYTEINNGRPIQIEGHFKSYKWLPLFEYKERLKLAGFDINQYNLIQLCLKEKDDFHYTFPILLLHVEAGDLKELDQLSPGDHIVIYGRFYNLKKSEFALETDIIETIGKNKHINDSQNTWGHDRSIVLDARVSPTPTPIPTVTPTPGPNVWNRINNYINPKESPTPTGTITPVAGQ